MGVNTHTEVDQSIDLYIYAFAELSLPDQMEPMLSHKRNFKICQAVCPLYPSSLSFIAHSSHSGSFIPRYITWVSLTQGLFLSSRFFRKSLNIHIWMNRTANSILCPQNSIKLQACSEHKAITAQESCRSHPLQPKQGYEFLPSVYPWPLPESRRVSSWYVLVGWIIGTKLYFCYSY